MQIPIGGAYEQFGMPGVAAFLFWGLAAIVLHELGHGFAAVWQGDDTPRREGRLTLNPLVHMGWLSIVFLCLVGIAWGSMPTDPSRFRWGRKGRVFVALAGPAAQPIEVLLGLCPERSRCCPRQKSTRAGAAPTAAPASQPGY